MIERREIERLRRHLKAITAKADDPAALAVIEALSAEWAELKAGQARKLTTEGERPYSWAEISRPQGISRQAAWKRYTA